MKNLLENQISAYLRPEKSIEQYIDRIEYSEYSVLRWVAVERTKEIYTLVIHEVFDERDEIHSIYDFSYLEPDEMYGKRIAEFKSLNETLELAEKEFGATADKYLPFGFLDEYLTKMEK